MTARHAGRLLACGLVALGILFSSQAAGAQESPAAAGALDIQARSALLVDAATGQELYAKNPDEPVPPASLTKILTLDLVFHALKEGTLSMDQQVPVSERAWRLSVQAGRGGLSAMFLEVGERVRVEDLIRGVAVASGNDASTVLAEAVAGTEESFVQRMNEHARAIGMTGSRFSNSHGLPGGEQQVTARDLVRLALHVLREHPEMLQYTGEKYLRWKDFQDQPNYNRLVFLDTGYVVDGLKTGHLAAAGYHVVATATDGDRRLVSIVLGASSDRVRVSESQRLLDYGFQQFVHVRVPFGDQGRRQVDVFKGQRRRVTVVPAAEPIVAVPREASEGVQARVELTTPLVAPVEKGARVGTLLIQDAEGRPLRQVPLVTDEAVPRGGFLRVLWDSLRMFLRDLFA